MTGAAGAVSIAGCIGGEDDGQDDDDNGTGGDDDGSGGAGDGDLEGELVRTEMRTRQRPVQPMDGHLNPYNPSNWIRQFNSTIYDWTAFYGRNLFPETREQHMPESDAYDGHEAFIPQILKDWTFPDTIEPGATVTLQLRDDDPHTWHNGDPVVARDYVNAAIFNKYLGSDEWDFLSDVSVAGEYTVEYTLDTRFRDEFLYWMILQSVEILATKDELYGRHVEALEDSTTEDEEAEALSELQNRRIEYEDAIGNGPWQYVEHGSQEIVLERYDDYTAPANLDSFNDDPRVLLQVDEIPNFPDFRFVHFLFEREQEMFDTLQVDCGRPTQMVDPTTWPDELEHRKLYRHDGGGAAIFNFEHELIGRTAVRQAIAHIINRQQVLDAFFPPHVDNSMEMKHVPSGMGVEKTQYWLGDLYDEFNTYHNGENGDEHHQQARELLESEGFHEENGEWMTPDDEPWQPVFTTPTFWEKWQNPNVNQMRAFGVDAQLEVQEPGTYWGQTMQENDYEIGAHVFSLGGGGPPQPHPWFIYDGAFKGNIDDNPANTLISLPEEIEVPESPGDNDSSMETVEITPLVDELVDPDISSDRETEVVQKLAWIFNYQLPALPALNFVPAVAYNQGDFHYPEPETPFDYIDGYINSLPLGAVHSRTE